ncbi:AmmeMemoRadiSam system radical SAM enzyme [Geosporobacter ferrireducens]|uniref:AmmeMemoRadiSam system radical SAM enzyme n=1 Tax=Geosporobacter ferrireducens TaxID=1424294 RepID=A0A1D8GK30_9FIRM|nr:AmmeMemoRadiSam system radical SAM enzyme [Geosporobacter ferrireducens]AOT71212.1 AmmeMemoRadiSam system radical SAM enzyme [Geosporobacter ferrireducens]MTI58028.1 AmmeMemoRadiSam system radical SAM enzyme [Geosporobacter ferrireducens]
MKSKKEALFYRQLKDGRVQCDLCPHACKIPANSLGRCRIRKNEEGRLFSLNYGKITAYCMDPIEKKPLYHFYPGSRIFSIGSTGCNFTCQFCQNWHIAQKDPDGIYTTAENIINIAQNEKNNLGIAFTYNEPTVWFEFVFEVAQEAKTAGLKSVLITNGFMNEPSLKALLPYVDAMNIDLKSFSDSFYRQVCGGERNPVLETIKKAYNACHIEITSLLVHGLNDSREEIEAMAKWISEIGAEIPLHLSRYYPNYQMDREATPISRIYEAKEIAEQYLRYVYVGNVPGADRNTYCPRCKEIIVDRETHVKVEHLADNQCNRCGEKIAIIL